jgi:DNA (cytosine-5)-methyltransferase 1
VTVKRAFSKIRSNKRDLLHSVKENRTKQVRALISRIPKNGGSRESAGAKFRLDCHKKSDGFKDVYGRMKWNDVAPTITGGCFNPSKGRFLHPTRNRCITLREAAMLQSFPPSYYVSLKRGKSGAAQMIGNALPPEFIRRHAMALKASLQGNPRRGRKK